MQTFYGLGAITLLLTLGAASALDPVTIPGTTLGMSDHYLVVDETAGSAAVWQETNGLAGLQTEPTEFEDGTVVPADAQVA